MGIVFRKITWLVVVAAVGYGIYYASAKWWKGPLTWENVKRQGTAVYKIVQEKAAGTTADTVKNEVRTYADQVVGEAKGGVAQYAKQKAGETLAGIGEKIVTVAGTIAKGTILKQSSVPPPTGAGFRVPAPPSALSFVVGAELVLSIAPGGSYEVRWGDATIDRGTVGEGAVRLVRHAWKKAGDYTVDILVTIPTEGASTVSFPVRVFSE